MLEVEFLGINGSIQERDSGNTSIIVKTDLVSIIVDVSANIQEAVESDIDIVILTHWHIDHVYALPSLLHQLWLKGRKKELEIILPEGIRSSVDALIDLFALRKKRGIFPIKIINASYHEYDCLSITTFKTDHTDDSIGVVFENNGRKLVYTSDTRPIKDAYTLLLNANMLIHEASGLSKNEEELIKQGHSSGLDAGVFARQAMAEKLFLCHLPTKDKELILEEARGQFKNSQLPRLLKYYKV